MQDRFPAKGTHLQRYSQVLSAVEINSSFYRPHRDETYARWRDSVPDGFRFSVKLPKTITHEKRLMDCESELAVFLQGVHHLRQKLGCLLVQMPPSLSFFPPQADRFLRTLRCLTDTDIACEPRHPSWFEADAAEMLHGSGIAYVEADPQIVMNIPVGNDDPVRYVRLHGSPTIYHSSYPDAYLLSLSARLVEQSRAGKPVWCVFDNTASGAAIENALFTLQKTRECGLFNEAGA